MADAEAPAATDVSQRGYHRLLLALVAASLATQAWLIFIQEFNWDEFLYLAQVHDYLRGDLRGALQTFHVHLFAWLPRLPGDEINQLIAGRLAMLLCVCVTLFAIYKLCRIWTDRGPALFAVGAFALMPATLQHGASFRVDPLALALSMAALASIGRAKPSWKSAAAIALLIAMAALVTIKIVFFAPAFAGIALWRLTHKNERNGTFRWLAATGFLTAIMFLLLYAAHQASLPEGSVASSKALAEGSASKVFSDTMLFLRRRVLAEAMFQAPAQWGLILAGIVMLTYLAWRGPDRSRNLALLGCAAPLLCLPVYRNAYPYFIPFVTAPAMPVVAWLIQSRGWSNKFQLLLVLIMGVTAVAAMPWIVSRDQKAQRAVIGAVHQIFPVPVNMIDHGHMIASFPSSGFFMSNWGMESYLAGPPKFADALAKDPVPLLVVSGKPLENAMGLIPWDVSFFPIKPEDRKVLRDNFIPHWGPIWVAGYRVRTSTAAQPFEVAVPGPYTVEGGDVRLDGQSCRQGDVVQLGRGIHQIAGDQPAAITLRWGSHLPRPVAAPPSQPLFVGF